MDMAEIVPLSVEERIQLVQAIWDSIADEQSLPPLSDAEKQLLDRRIADLDTHPEKVLTWEEIKTHVRREK